MNYQKHVCCKHRNQFLVVGIYGEISNKYRIAECWFQTLESLKANHLNAFRLSVNECAKCHQNLFHHNEYMHLVRQCLRCIPFANSMKWRSISAFVFTFCLCIRAFVHCLTLPNVWPNKFICREAQSILLNGSLQNHLKDPNATKRKIN